MEKTWLDRIDAYERVARQVEPTVRLGPKDALGWKVLWYFGAIMTLGLLAWALPLERFVRDFGSGVGPWVGIPRKLERLNLRFLRHEARHVGQFVLAGWFVPVFGWIFGRTARAVAGILPLGIVYTLLPLPLGLALGRYLIEANAEETAWKIGLADGTVDESEIRRRSTVFGEMLAGREYLWAWPWAVRGMRKRADRVLAESHPT